jgi:predicted porin
LTDQSIYEVIATYDFGAFATKFTYALKNDKYVFAPAKEDKIEAMAFYLGYKRGDWGVAARLELVDKNPDGTVVPATPNTGLTGDEQIQSVTLTGHYDLETNARLKVEVGTQTGEDTSFVEGDGNASSHMMFYGLGLQYRF